jgi:integrase
VKGHKLSQNTNDNYHTIIRKYFYDWQARPLKEITREMVIARHSAITDGKLKAGPDYKPSHMKPSPSSANKAMRLLRSIYNFSNIHYDEGPEVAATDNPVIRITALKKWNKEGSRSTRLFDGDLKPWFEAVLSLKGDPDSFSDTAADFLIFLLLTGLRRREASTLKWVDVNLRSSFFTILETKNGIPHKLPLTDYLLTMMKERRLNVPGEYVFPGGGKNDSIGDPRLQVEYVRSQAGVNFTLHDLRRTFASVAESLDIPAYALKRLLNHSGGRDVTGEHYIVIDHERLRRPMQLITDYFLRAGGVSPANVVGLAGSGVKAV